MEITSIKSFLAYYVKIRERANNLIKVIPREHSDFAYMAGKLKETGVLYLRKIRGTNPK